jgi:hypothetical protein
MPGEPPAGNGSSGVTTTLSYKVGKIRRKINQTTGEMHGTLVAPWHGKLIIWIRKSFLIG